MSINGRGGEQRAIIMHYYPILKALLMLVEEALKCPRVISSTSDNKVNLKPNFKLQLVQQLMNLLLPVHFSETIKTNF